MPHTGWLWWPVCSSAAVPCCVFAWEKYKRGEGQTANPRKPHTVINRNKMCTLREARRPQGKGPPAESDQLAERGGAGVCGPDSRAEGREGTKTGHRAALGGVQDRREVAVPGQRLRHSGFSSAALSRVAANTPRSRPSPSSPPPQEAPGRDLGHLRSRSRPARSPQGARAAAVGLGTAQPPLPAPNGRAGGGWGRRAGPLPAAVRQPRNCSLRSRPPSVRRAPRHLPGPTPSQRPPALGPSPQRRSSRPGPEMAAEQREPGSGERRPIGRGAGPPRELSAAVALATAAGPRPDGLRRAPGGARQRFLNPRRRLGLGSPRALLCPVRPRLKGPVSVVDEGCQGPSSHPDPRPP